MLKGLFGKDAPLREILILAAGVAAVFLAAKFGAQYLPSNGFGGALKKIVGSV